VVLERDRFIAPLQIADGHVISARRRPGKSGVVIAAAPLEAASPEAIGRPVWETVIAPASAPAPASPDDDNSLLVPCATGDCFPVAVEAAGRAVVNLPLKAAVSVSAAQNSVLRGVTWRGGHLLPNEKGQIGWEPAAGSNLRALLPFQPKLIVGAPPVWLAPQPVTDEQFVAADAAGAVYLVTATPEPVPHLAAAAQASLNDPIVAPPAIIDQHVFVATRAAASDVVNALTFEELQLSPPLKLPGRVRWGPFALGQLLLLATQPGGVLAVDSQLKQRWSFDTAGELPVGAPVQVGDTLVVAATSGKVWRVNIDSGAVGETLDVRQPLGSGMQYIAPRLLLRAVDGSVLLVELE
jgi:hypothetical protein